MSPKRFSSGRSIVNCGRNRRLTCSLRRWGDLEHFLNWDSRPKLLLRAARTAEVSFFSRYRKRRAIDSSVEFNPHLATRTSRRGAFVKIHESFHLTHIHRRFELDEFIF